MKKTIMFLKSVAVCGMMAASFIGCGGNSDSSGGSKSQPTPDPKEVNTADSLAVIAQLNAEYERTQEEWLQGIKTGEWPEIHQRNVMTVMINRRGEILTEINLHAHLCPIESVKNRTIMFLTPCREPRLADTLPSLPCLKNDGTHPQTWETYFDGIGNVPVSQGSVFLLKNNDGTSLATFNNVKQELIGAILEMRNIQSERYFGRSYFQLTEKERQTVAEMIPMSIIETTSKELYETPPPPPEWDIEEIKVVENPDYGSNETKIAVVEFEEEEEVEEIVILPEVDPEFPGGMDALYKYLSDNIQYPQLARDNNITGKVYIGFVVEKDGSVTNAKVIRDIGGGCGQEALRVVMAMPKWKPGKVGSRTVRSNFSLSVHFELQ